MAIPKIIHYCWFGGNPKSKLALNCILSWKKFCPEYKFYEWNESNFDVNSNIYVKEAYENKKYAFVSDYVRLKALYEVGGIYLDTDVELLKSLDDLLFYQTVVGFEEKKFIMTGFLATECKQDIFEEWLDSYKDRHYIIKNGKQDNTTNVHIFTNILKNHGLITNGEFQTFSGITVFPSEYFSPRNYYTEKTKITFNTYAIHHFERSWCEKETLTQRTLRRHPKLNYLYHIPNRIGMRLLGHNYKKLKRMLKK